MKSEPHRGSRALSALALALASLQPLRACFWRVLAAASVEAVMPGTLVYVWCSALAIALLISDVSRCVLPSSSKIRQPSQVLHPNLSVRLRTRGPMTAPSGLFRSTGLTVRPATEIAVPSGNASDGLTYNGCLDHDAPVDGWPEDRVGPSSLPREVSHWGVQQPLAPSSYRFLSPPLPSTLQIAARVAPSSFSRGGEYPFVFQTFRCDDLQSYHNPSAAPPSTTPSPPHSSPRLQLPGGARWFHPDFPLPGQPHARPTHAPPTRAITHAPHLPVWRSHTRHISRSGLTAAGAPDGVRRSLGTRPEPRKGLRYFPTLLGIAPMGAPLRVGSRRLERGTRTSTASGRA